MTWTPEIEQLEQLRRLRKRMGGAEGIARQHQQGRLTVRERLGLLVDPESFQELGTSVGAAKYDQEGRLQSFRPGAFVDGQANIEGRPVLIDAGDFTIRGGSADGTISHRRVDMARLAGELRLPFIRLLDGAGGSVRNYDSEAKGPDAAAPGTHLVGDQEPLVGAARTGTPGSFDLPRLHDVSPIAPMVENHLLTQMARGNLLAQVPVVAAVLGSVAGLPAVYVGESHFSVMTRNSETFVGGPPMVVQALGQKVTKQELGDWRMQAKTSGVVNNVAEDEADAFVQIRRFLSYLPPNVWQLPPWVEAKDDPNRREESLLSIIPRRRSTVYDVRQLIAAVVDKDSTFEISALYGRALVTMLARMDGFPVAVVANDCRRDGGAMTPAACIKYERFIDFADTFHLPVVYFCDVPGFMVGADSEAAGIIRFANRACFAAREASVPFISIVMRRMYGVAGVTAKQGGMSVRYAWPSAESGSLVAQGGVMAAFRREIEAAPDPKARQQEIEERFIRMASILRQPGIASPMEIIDPRDTRPAVIDYIRKTHAVNATRLGPKIRVGMRP
jgi:acetyl-CoA carboxylase carboxyltransferase component